MGPQRPHLNRYSNFDPDSKSNPGHALLIPKKKSKMCLPTNTKCDPKKLINFFIKKNFFFDMGQLTLTTFTLTVFSCLQIYSTNHVFECVWFCVPLKNARDDSAKNFIFRLAKNPLADDTEQISSFIFQKWPR